VSGGAARRGDGATGFCGCDRQRPSTTDGDSAQVQRRPALLCRDRIPPLVLLTRSACGWRGVSVDMSIAAEVECRGRDGATPAKLLRFTPYWNTAGTMLGFFSAELPSGMVVHGLKLMLGPAGKCWVAMPDSKRRDKDDRPVQEGGKPVYDAFIEFRDRAVRDRFVELLLEALRRAHPSAFGEPPRQQRRPRRTAYPAPKPHSAPEVPNDDVTDLW
jgi:DNA-binding cell septation regulator SpoVG